MKELIKGRLEKGIPICPFVKDCDIDAVEAWFQCYCTDQVGCIFCGEHNRRMKEQSELMKPSEWLTFYRGKKEKGKAQ